jgi:hypothetical protein
MKITHENSERVALTNTESGPIATYDNVYRVERQQPDGSFTEYEVTVRVDVHVRDPDEVVSVFTDAAIDSNAEARELELLLIEECRLQGWKLRRPLQVTDVLGRPVVTTCSDSPTRHHEPDLASLKPADGADWIVDVTCRHCGRGGSQRIEPNDFNWD